MYEYYSLNFISLLKKPSTETVSITDIDVEEDIIISTDVTTLELKGPEVKGTEIVHDKGMQIIKFKDSRHCKFL